MSKYDNLSLFKCFVCLRYKPVDQAAQILIKGILLPKDVCKECLDKAVVKGVKSNGLEVLEEKNEGKNDKPLSEKEIKMLEDDV